MWNVAGQRVLVTGAAGCVGANLVRALLELRSDVHVVLRPSSAKWRIAELLSRLSVHWADLADGRAVRRIVATARPAAVFHCAVTRDENISAQIQGNVVATSNLLNATAPLDDLRFVHLGSSLEYGPSLHAKREDDPLRPIAAFGMTKAAATLLAQQAAGDSDRHVTILRLFHVYGPYEAPSRLIPTAIQAALAGCELPLTSSGFRRDCVYVGDVVDACLLAGSCSHAAGEIFNIASGKETSNEEIVELVGRVADRPIRVCAGNYPSRATDTERWRADISKARELQPQHTLESGLRTTLAWMHETQARPVAAGARD
jgi:nucleoside-diphosphate-sugar epimerase